MTGFAGSALAARVGRGCRLAAAIVVVLPFVAAGATGAAADWKAEWDRIVAAAKEEGAVQIAMTRNPVMRRVVQDLWPKAFPEIKLAATVTGRGWDVRLQSERKIGKYLYDIYLSSPNPGIYKVAPEVLDPLPPALVLPDVKDPATWGGWDEAFCDRNRNRLLAFATFTGTLWYNADAVAPQKAEKLGFKILLDPAYKGKIAWWDPRSPVGAGATYAHLIYRVEGWDTLKKILVDQESVFYSNAQQAAEAIVRGKALFTVGANLNNRLTKYRKAGINIDFRPLGRTPDVAHLAYGGTVVGLMNKPRNPNAAKLFLNWFLTKEVQKEALTALRHNSRRVDMPVITKDWIAAVPGAKYLSLQHERNSEERRALVKRMRALFP